MLEMLTEMEVDITQYMRKWLWAVVWVVDKLELEVRVRVGVLVIWIKLT
jgi:type II secretory pathway component PulJ